MSMGEPCVPGCAVGVYCTGQCLVVLACLLGWALTAWKHPLLCGLVGV